MVSTTYVPGDPYFGRPIVDSTNGAASRAANGTWLVALESARLAGAGGVPAERFVEILEAGDRLMGGPIAILKRMGMATAPEGDDDRAARERLAGCVHKDLRAALELTEELGLELPAAQLTDAAFEASVAIGSAV